MLHEILANYLDRVEQAILGCSNAYVERYTEEILSGHVLVSKDDRQPVTKRLTVT